MTDRVWDLLVVGGGTAGIVAARTAAGFGARVLLAEQDRTGGDCLWTGCVPSKALLAAADAAATARGGGRLGVHADRVRVDFTEVIAHVKSAIAAIEPGDSVESLAAAGIHMRRGAAVFTGPAGADIAGQPVSFRQAVVATGSTPALPGIDGLDAADPLTSDTIWDLDELPGRLAVLGAGSIGCELGQAFARLGSAVTMIDTASRPLAREDPSASESIARALRADGITLRLDATVSTITAQSLTLADGTVIGFDRLLVAAGRQPRTATLDLDAAGVETDERGYIRVDKHLRTSNRRVWAAGDVTGHPQFTHTAGVHGSAAATNAILGLRRRADVALQPRVTFTQPEIAAVGAATGHTPGRDVRLYTIGNEHVDRAITDGHTDGFTRLAVDRKGHIVGATIVGPRAGESLAELVLAARLGLRARDLAATTHPYPTYTLGPWDASIAARRAAMDRPAASRAIRAAAAIRKALVGGRAEAAS